MIVNGFLQKDYENEPPTGPKKQTQSNPTCHGLPPSEAGSPATTIFFKNQKNAQIFKKLLICTCFYSIIVLFYTLYGEAHLSVEYGEGV